MKLTRPLPALFVLAIALAGVGYLLLPQQDAAHDWEQRKARFRQAAERAGPLLQAINAYTAAVGHPPSELADVVPDYLPALPATGLPECPRFEYRLLTHKQGSIVWYDLGSRQGQPPARPGRYHEGDPDHAILVFTLDAGQQITGALIDRLPKGRKPLDFDPRRWKAGDKRIEMALSLRKTYQLYGMPQDVFERLLGTPDGSRVVHGPPWELRINCPTGLLNHDTFVYWPTGKYPQHLYGGTIEPISRWAYVHS
jgi:hypothetical protein